MDTIQNVLIFVKEVSVSTPLYCATLLKWKVPDIDSMSNVYEICKHMKQDVSWAWLINTTPLKMVKTSAEQSPF